MQSGAFGPNVACSTARFVPVALTAAPPATLNVLPKKPMREISLVGDYPPSVRSRSGTRSCYHKRVAGDDNAPVAPRILVELMVVLVGSRQR
jgi:hypothetical protein